MILYSLLKYGLAERAISFSLTALSLAVASLIAVYLYYGIAWLASCERSYGLWIGTLAAVLVGYTLSGGKNVWSLVCDWSMIFLAGAVTGRLSRTHMGSRATYFIGLIIVVFFGLLWLLPKWPQLMQAATEASSAMVDNLQFLNSAGLVALGSAGSIEQISALLVRLLPVFLIMSLASQYSIGTLCFEITRSHEAGSSSPLRSFIHWRMFSMMWLLTACAAGLGFVFGGTIRLVTDNLLVALSMFYCVIGLSVIEYHLHRLQLHLALKIILYLLLIPTGLAGFLAVALVGLINNVHDWRSAPEAD